MYRTSDARGLLTQTLCLPEAAGSHRFVAVAGNRGLRWIIPADLGRASVVLQNWQPYNRLSRLGWHAIQLAARSNVLSLAPGTHNFTADLSHVSWRSFCWTSDRAPRLLAYVGTPGRYQKLVCSLVDDKALQIVSIVKFPLVETAKERLRREFHTLEALARRACTLGPAPLHLDDQTRFTVQSFLPGRPSGFTDLIPHIEFLAQLIDPETRIELREMREQLLVERDALVAQGKLVGRSLDRLDAAMEKCDWDGDVPSVRAHGDFAPWNLRLSHDGKIMAVDWEESVASELPYFDLHHFRRTTRLALQHDVSIPWNDYTAALRRNDPTLTPARAANLRVAAGLRHQVRYLSGIGYDVSDDNGG